jgi:hypothetical protein
MPGRADGLGLVRHARQNYPAIRSIMVSGDASERDATTAGAEKFIPKPYLPNTIILAVRDLANAAQFQRGQSRKRKRAPPPSGRPRGSGFAKASIPTSQLPPKAQKARRYGTCLRLARYLSITTTKPLRPALDAFEDNLQTSIFAILKRAMSYFKTSEERAEVDAKTARRKALKVARDAAASKAARETAQ